MNNTQVLHPIEGMDPLQQIMRTMEADLETGGWDQPTRFYVMRWHPTHLELREWPLPEEVTQDTGNMLPPFARFFAGLPIFEDSEPPLLSEEDRIKGLRVLAGDHFYGVVVFGEGWTLPDVDRAEFRAHTVHEAPDRIEMRYGLVATVDGRLAHISRNRGAIPEYTEATEAESLLGSGGRVIDSLRLLCHAIGTAANVGAGNATN